MQPVTPPTREPRGRVVPAILWLFGLGVCFMAVALVLVSRTALSQQREISRLRQQIQVLEVAQQETESSVAALQSSVDATESFLAQIEADMLRAQVDSLEADLNGLQRRLAAIEEERAETDTSAVAEVPGEVRLSVARQQQSHNLSCESSAASMAAHYHSVPLSESEILGMLPRNSNPHLGFRGNVDGPTGGLEDYGVYAGPIREILNAQGLWAEVVWDGLEGIEAALARGNPVLAWITYDCLPGMPVQVTIDGQAVTLVPSQHTVVVTGYNAEGFWINDPWDGQEHFYSRHDFAQAFAYLGDMAVEVGVP